MFQNIFPCRGRNLAALSLFTTKSIDNVRVFDDKQTISYPVCFSYLERLPPVSGREGLPKCTGTRGGKPRKNIIGLPFCREIAEITALSRIE
jgi:hypothetical protein